MRIDWWDEAWEPRPERALFRPAGRALLVADLHLGKSAAFRARGVPVPEGPTGETLDRLARAVASTGAERLWILGDLLHARAARAPETLGALASWRAAHRALDVVLVRGNHDRHAGDPPAALGFTCVGAPWAVDGVALCHDPEGAPARAIAGHVHPCVRRTARALGRVRAPCFVFGPRRILLPAFGDFTGGTDVRRARGERVFAVGPGAVVEA